MFEFFVERRTLRSGYTNNLRIHSKILAHEEQSTATSELIAVKRFGKIGTELSLDVFEEKIEDKLEPFLAQISSLTRLMDKLIQDNSAKTYPRLSTRECRFSSDSQLTDERGASKTLPLAPSVTTVIARQVSKTKKPRSQR